MGRSARPKPARLGEKLLRIRTEFLGLSQTQMLDVLGLKGKVFHSAVSDYELDRREPPLAVILNYARAAGLTVESIIDDQLELEAGRQCAAQKGRKGSGRVGNSP